MLYENIKIILHSFNNLTSKIHVCITKMSEKLFNAFKSVYKTEYTNQKLPGKSQFPHYDCFENSLHKEKQIDHEFAAAWKLSDEEAEKLIKKLYLERLQTVYKVDYRDPMVEIDGNDRNTSISPASNKKKGKQFESELLRYLDDLYYNPHDEKVLAPPITAKRVFGYASPNLLHRILSSYQDTIGRDGATVMFKNAELMSKLDRK